MLLPNRHGNSSDYRYGFVGHELDNELKGEGNSYDFGARFYDPRIVRWFKMDNEHRKLPYLSPYGYVNNNPIRFIDPDGNFLIDVYRRITMLAFSRSKRGSAYYLSQKNGMVVDPDFSKDVLAYRQSIVGSKESSFIGYKNQNYIGSVVAPDVRSLPKWLGGGGQESVETDHFDSMNYDGIIINMSNIQSNIDNLTALYTEGTITAKELGNKVGEHFHAIQDLYSHSNYIELYKAMYGETDITKIPTFEEAQTMDKYKDFAHLLETSLKTGEYPGKGAHSHKGMNHDKGKGTFWLFRILPEVFGQKVNWNTKAAEEVATRATMKINDKIEKKIK